MWVVNNAASALRSAHCTTHGRCLSTDTCGSTVAYSGKPMVQITTIVSCVFPLQKVDVPHRPLQSVFSRSSSLQWPTRLQLSSFVIEPRPHALQSSLLSVLFSKMS